MSQRTWNVDYGPLRGLYRNRESGWIFGVCAGIADRFNVQVGAVRIIATVSLVLCFWLTAAIYVGATFLIREKPLIYSGQETESRFWQRNRDDRWSPS